MGSSGCQAAQAPSRATRSASVSTRGCSDGWLCSGGDGGGGGDGVSDKLASEWPQAGA